MECVDGARVERIDDRHDQLSVAHRDRHHLVLARKRTRDLGLDHLDVELQRIDLEKVKMRILSDQARQQEVVDARAAAAGISQVHPHQRLERARFVVRARL